MIARQYKRIRLQIKGTFPRIYVRVHKTSLHSFPESHTHNIFCLFP